MKNSYLRNALILCLFIAGNFPAFSQQPLDSLLPVRGFCIGSPSSQEVDRFVKFIDKELAPRKVNTLIVRIDYHYQYKTHPELADSGALSKADIQKMLTVCRKNNINLVPQINLLGHQSWAGKTNKLLAVYPEFDETPNVKMPAEYKWPNDDYLYCKSYCPLHPEVHKVVFDIVNELCDVFQATDFHAGMDEVFYLGERQCPRCSGRDKAELFAGEVTAIRNNLAQKNRRLWIWGDRLIDGKETGIGIWEASYNYTYRAVNMIPKDVMICDWHYERADKTPVYFAMNGLDVVTCPWRRAEVALQQVDDMLNFRNSATKQMKPHFAGMMQTVWSGAGIFLDGFYGNTKDDKGGEMTPWHCFRALYQKINSL